MQRIERYGVIALLLLLVTVLAVSMWGEETVDAADSQIHTLASTTPTRRETAKRRETPTRTTPRRNSQVESGVPLSNKTRPSKVKTRPTVVTNTQPRNQANSRPRVNPRRNTAPSAAQNNRNREFALANSGSNTVKRATEPKRAEPQKVNRMKPAASLVVTQKPESTKPLKPASIRNKPLARAKTWTVKSGETLSEISQQALGTATLWREIAAANPGVDPNRLSVGTQLVLPSNADLTASAKPVAKESKSLKPRTVSSAGGTYTVQSGDVLSVIAQRELGSAKRWREIVSLNPSVDPDRLTVGSKLVLPSTGVATVSRPVSSNSLAVARAPKSSTKLNRVR